MQVKVGNSKSGDVETLVIVPGDNSDVSFSESGKVLTLTLDVESDVQTALDDLVAADVVLTDDLDEAEEDISDHQTQINALPTFKLITFTETAAAGVYTGTVALPTDAVVIFVSYETTAAWANDTTTMDLGYTSALTAWGNDINVDGAVDVVVLPAAAVAPTVHGAGIEAIFTLTSVGSSGTTGRTRVVLGYTVPETVVAVKAA